MIQKLKSQTTAYGTNNFLSHPSPAVQDCSNDVAGDATSTHNVNGHEEDEFKSAHEHLSPQGKSTTTSALLKEGEDIPVTAKKSNKKVRKSLRLKNKRLAKGAKGMQQERSFKEWKAQLQSSGESGLPDDQVGFSEDTA